MTSPKVVDLNAHVPQDVRVAAKRAYNARLKHRKAHEDLGNAMRWFSQACKRFKIDPRKLQVGELDGTSLVPADHWEAP